MRRRTTPLEPTAWVDAAPFAAHLTRLCAASGLSWRVVATYAGVSLRTAERLVGAPRLRRIPRVCAQQLWAIHPDELATLHHTWVDADPTTRRVAQLVERGVSVSSLAAHLGCSAEEVVRLADGSMCTVRAIVAVRARVAVEGLDRHRTHAALAAA